MTKEEIFTKSVGGILAQGGGSYNDRTCLYRGSDQRKCAAGHLISDDRYDLATEGQSLRQLRRYKASYLPWDESFDDFVIELQTAHDNAVRDNRVGGKKNVLGDAADKSFLADFKKSAQAIADAHGIKIIVDSL